MIDPETESALSSLRAEVTVLKLLLDAAVAEQPRSIREAVLSGFQRRYEGTATASGPALLPPEFAAAIRTLGTQHIQSIQAMSAHRPG